MDNDWWGETDDSLLACLRDGGAMSPAEIGLRLGISAREATAFICMLATQGKVSIRLVELADREPRRSSASRTRRRNFAAAAAR